MMTEILTFKKLVVLNPTKAQGLNAISGRLLKENSDRLAGPICDIFDYSYRNGRLPSVWKEADVVPVPKQRPISLTSIISKIAEEHVVES